MSPRKPANRRHQRNRPRQTKKRNRGADAAADDEDADAADPTRRKAKLPRKQRKRKPNRPWRNQGLRHNLLVNRGSVVPAVAVNLPGVGARKPRSRSNRMPRTAGKMNNPSRNSRRSKPARSQKTTRNPIP